MLTGSLLGVQYHPYVDEVAFDVENQEKAHAAELGCDCAVSHPVIHLTRTGIEWNFTYPNLKHGGNGSLV